MIHQHSPEVKAQVVAALLAGQSISSVAKEYKLPRGTVGYWAGQVRPLGGQSGPTTKKEIGDLLVEYLRAAIVALRQQAEVFTDAKWLEKQSASELGLLHGILADKTVRLLEALSPEQAGEGIVS